MYGEINESWCTCRLEPGFNSRTFLQSDFVQPEKETRQRNVKMLSCHESVAGKDGEDTDSHVLKSLLGIYFLDVSVKGEQKEEEERSCPGTFDLYSVPDK